VAAHEIPIGTVRLTPPQSSWLSWGWSWTSGVRTHQLLLIGAVVGMIAVLVAGVTLLSAVPPDYRGAVQLRNPVPLDEEFANLNRVSHWPADWINAVCEPPLYQLRN
jgi:hypothetical protein